MSNDQVRSLTSLDKVISSSRVLNLNKIYKMHRRSAEHSAKPLFSNALLNRSIILKHRLRAGERHHFTDGRSVATKILFPLDTMELKLGAQYIFVGQKDFEDRLCEILEDKAFNLGADIFILNLIDSIPSLDSYLLREFLTQAGIRPADCYLENGVGDRKHVQQFVLNEITTLAKMSLGPDSDGIKIRLLRDKLLSPEAATVTDNLRESLQMEKLEYRTGLFYWKAILFYKWQIKKSAPFSGKIFREMRRIHPVGFTKRSEQAAIEKMRAKIAYKFSLICDDVDKMQNIYDSAYNQFIYKGNTVQFKEFLISAPILFKQLGERFNDVGHMVNFWKYRPKKGHSAATTLEVLTSTLTEFESISNLDIDDRQRA